MCNCTGQEASNMSEAVGNKVLISYNAKSISKHPVRGMSTKTYYGYRRRGDQFEVYESDIRVRPDLFRPINTKPEPRSMPSHRGRPQEAANVLGVKAMAEAVQEAPPPPVAISAEPNEPDPYELPSPLEMSPQEDIEFAPGTLYDTRLEWDLGMFNWEGKINKRHIGLLAESDIKTLRDLIPLTEDNVLAIKGIGPSVTRALFSKLKEIR